MYVIPFLPSVWQERLLWPYGLLVTTVLILYYRRAKGTLAWTPDSIQLESDWTLPWSQLKTVNCAWGGIELTDINGKTYTINRLTGANLHTAAVVIGRHLTETAETEVSRPLKPADIDGRNLRKATVYAICSFLVLLALLIGIFQSSKNPTGDNIRLAAILFTVGIFPLGLFSLTALDLVRYLRIQNRPELVDPNRDLEKAFYDQYGHHAEHASRFWRHVWQNTPKGAGASLPK